MRLLKDIKRLYLQVNTGLQQVDCEEDPLIKGVKT